MNEGRQTESKKKKKNLLYMHTAEVLSSLSQHQKASCCHQLAYNSSITHLSYLEAKALTSLSALLCRRAPHE